MTALVRLGIAELGRQPKLRWNLVRGFVDRLRRQTWWFFFSTLFPVGVALGALALADLGDWIEAWSALTIGLSALALRWIFKARGRVVVESFVDFTKEDAKAVSGLSTLLVTELGRLRNLYQQIGDLSVPTAVGVESHGGFGRGKEAGVFLTVSADDATTVLEGAVASDAGIGVGPAKISLKPILTLVNRISRGPRVVGSVHLTEAGGGPTLTAQITGTGECRTWRIDQPREPVSLEQRKAFLDTMVRELACQMFSQLTLQGSIRPKAVEAFNKYLQRYDEARRTPGDRAHLLKVAQGELLEAVAEDEQFDLAYYNLGVIYSQLAHTERVAEQETEDATSCARFDRSELIAARAEAARVAFERAAAKNPNRWEAYYALAVTRFSAIEAIEVGSPAPADAQKEALQTVVSLCEQALAVARKHEANLAAVYDLRGMAQTRLGTDFHAALKSHRKAVRHSWIEYCEARRRDAGRTEGLPDLVAHARDNATAALHNLALAYGRRALVGTTPVDDDEQGPAEPPEPAAPQPTARRPSAADRLDLFAARWILFRAARLAGGGSAVTAASRFERGGAFEAAGNFKRAAEQFQRAALVQPQSCEYRARWAQALAKQRRRVVRQRGSLHPKAAELREEARSHALHALDLLSQPFSVAVLPFRTKALALRCNATLAALEETYRSLEDEDKVERIAEMRKLEETLEDKLVSRDSKTGKRRRVDHPFDAAESLKGLRLRLQTEADEGDRETKARAALFDPSHPRGEKAVLTETRSSRSRPAGGGVAFSENGQGELPTPRTWQLDQVELAMGRLYADGRRWKQAGAVFQSLLERLSEEHRRQKLIEFGVYAQLARTLREREQFVEALRTAAEGIRRSPLDVESRREAGRAHVALGQYSDALDAWQHALWLSPADPYLHYEVGMCHRSMAHAATDDLQRRHCLDAARTHIHRARELFDGEDLEGEAWSRFWCGKIAFEADEPAAALAHLEGAEHGTARAAAALLLAEAHLRLDQRPAAEHAFARCEQALGRKKGKSLLRGRRTIDALWGDELPLAAVRARIKCGEAEAKYLSPGDWQDSENVREANALLEKASENVADLKHPNEAGARDEAKMRILETESRLFQARGEIEQALDRVREGLRYKTTEEALRLEAELLELSAEQGKRIKEATRRRIAAKHVKKNLPLEGRRRGSVSAEIRES